MKNLILILLLFLVMAKVQPICIEPLHHKYRLGDYLGHYGWCRDREGDMYLISYWITN